MTEEETPTDGDENRIQKNLDDCDHTRGFKFEHYSHKGVAAACHATEGQSHE